MARLYSLKTFNRPQHVAADPYPGFTLSEIIDQFLAEGVVPDFLPADLGEDHVEEFDNDGYPIVDPAGNIRVSRMDQMEAALFDGVTDPEPAPAPQPAPADPPTE